MICDICGKNTGIIFQLAHARICADCATMSVAQLANEGWVDVEEEKFLTVPAFVDGVPVEHDGEKKKNFDDKENEKKVYCLYSGHVVDAANVHCSYAIDTGVTCDTCPHKYNDVDEAHDFADREGKNICHCALLDIDVIKGSKPDGCNGEGDCESCAHCVDYFV